jgi:quercetin dioxygenase-like cupin family protein
VKFDGAPLPPSLSSFLNAEELTMPLLDDEFIVRFPGLPDLPATECGDQPMFDGRVHARTARQASAAGEQTVMATTFAPGAKTAWHIHEADQTLVVTAGKGALEDADGVHPLSTGDVVTVARGRRHRHLAADDSPMTHLSITGHGAHHIVPDSQA